MSGGREASHRAIRPTRVIAPLRIITMSSFVRPPAARRPLLRVLCGLLVAAAGCAGDAPVADRASSGSGLLVVGADTYRFRTSFCVAGADRFAAVGRGRAAGDPFVVTVRSPNVLSVKFGVTEELDAPSSDGAWLYATTTMRLASHGRSILGEGELLAGHRARRLARLALTCGRTPRA